MGGPSSSLLLPKKLTEAQIAGIEADLHKISSTVVKSQLWDWEFWINDTRPIGGDYVGEGRPFGISIEVTDVEEVDEREAWLKETGWYEEAYEDAAKEAALIEKEFGFKVQQKLDFDAMCNRENDHRAMGVLMLHFATRFDGIVDFGGALLPALPEWMYQDSWLWEKGQWADVEGYFQQMVEPMPGKIVNIKYETDNGRTWAHHVADSAFLKAWLQHPRFKMIK